MVKEITGEIQNIKPNRKSLTINGTWFNSFTLLDDSIKKGQNVKITYSEKEVDDKIFNNIKSLVQVKKELPEEKNKTETKIDWKVTESRESKEKVTSMMISYIKDVAVAVITNSKEYQDIDKVIENTTNQFIKSYHKIIENL